MDAFIETLHVTGTHSEAAPLSPDTSTQYDVWRDDPHFSRFHSLVWLPSPTMLAQPTEQETLDAFTSMYLPEVFGSLERDLAPCVTPRQPLSPIRPPVYRSRMVLSSLSPPASYLSVSPRFCNVFFLS